MAEKVPIVSGHGLSVAANVSGDRFEAMLEAIKDVHEARSLILSARLLGKASLWDIVRLASGNRRSYTRAGICSGNATTYRAVG